MKNNLGRSNYVITFNYSENEPQIGRKCPFENLVMAFVYKRTVLPVILAYKS